MLAFFCAFVHTDRQTEQVQASSWTALSSIRLPGEPGRFSRSATQGLLAMQENYLIVVDVQNDFVSGSLGTPEARAIVPALCARVRDFQGTVLLTRDTHYADYLTTQEGRLLPIVHCVEGTEGWQLVPELEEVCQARNLRIFDKETFASVALASELAERAKKGEVAGVEFAGLCTDICVISNALLLKSMAPQIPLFVDPACCAGTTPERHEAALKVLHSCQILPGSRKEAGHVPV